MIIGVENLEVSNTLPEIWQCCGEQPTHIFFYEGGEIFLICFTHFTSTEHRAYVNNVIDYKTGKKLDVVEIFGDTL